MLLHIWLRMTQNIGESLGTDRGLRLQVPPGNRPVSYRCYFPRRCTPDRHPVERSAHLPQRLQAQYAH